MTAKQARELSGVDSRTPKEKFIDDVNHYIKMEATRGNRKMIYRIPERYSNRYLVWDIKQYFEDLGYNVTCSYPDYPDMIFSW